MSTMTWWRHLVNAYEVTAGWRLCDRLAPLCWQLMPVLNLRCCCTWPACRY